MRGATYIGTSGWTYRIWRESVYAGIPQRRWLEHYATLFTAVEVNATFYHLLLHSTFQKWRARTPDGFRFTIKGNRYLTHVRRLAEAKEGVRLEKDRACGLGDKLAAVVWQMPPGLGKDMDRLREFAAALREWPETRHALEFRNTSWFGEETAKCLSEHRLAACVSDAADWPMWLAETTDLVYVRLHGHDRTYRSSYTDEELRAWSARITEWTAEGRTVHVYFDNTDEGHAPTDAERLANLVLR